MTDILDNYKDTKLIKKASLITRDISKLMYGNVEVPGPYIRKKNEVIGDCACDCSCNCNCNCD